jgi:RNA-directed DNA polymerase
MGTILGRLRRNCRRAVTGLIITPNGDISVGRKNKRMLKALLCQFSHGNISQENTAYLQGYLAFLLDVEPAYFNRLALKYGADVVDRALSRRQSP